MKKLISMCAAALILLSSMLVLYAGATEVSSPVIDKVERSAPKDKVFTITVTVKTNGKELRDVIVQNASKVEVAKKAPADAEADGTFLFQLEVGAEYYVFAYDTDGTSGTPKGYFVDSKPPKIVNISYDNDSYTNKPIKVEFTVEDTSKIKSAVVKDAASKNLTVTNESGKIYSFNAESNGDYVISATDEFGNASSSERININKIDTEKPKISVTIPETDGVSKEPITITIKATDNVGVATILINGKAHLDTDKVKPSYTIEYKALESGDVTIEVSDLAGNTVTEVKTIGNVDLQPPVLVKHIEITELTGVEAKAVVEVTDDNPLTYEWYILGGTSSDYGKIDAESAPEVLIKNLKKQTTYTLKVVVTDVAGNQITDTKAFTTPNDGSKIEKPKDYTIFIIIGAVVLFIIASISIILFLMFRKKNSGDDAGGDEEAYNDPNEEEYAEYPPEYDGEEYADELEPEYEEPIDDSSYNYYNEAPPEPDDAEIGRSLYRQTIIDENNDENY
ncbi:MAG: hypothetical protein LBS74_09340 [Oscillospiraceae bacterium]|jgi:hypothetical protein|nr:hypothetical protein [Oscillospiraceae bacterium]